MTRLLSTESAIMVLLGTGLVAISYLSLGKVTLRAKIALIFFSALFLLTVQNSIFPGLSVVFCFFLFSSAVLFISLDIETSSESADTKQETLSNLDSAKFAIFAMAIVHALVQIAFYIAEPKRTTGLLDDFSQAAFFLLLAYGLVYPKLKRSSYFPATALIIFVAFFTTFSRSANFLLILFFIGLFIYEWKEKNILGFSKQLLIALIALTLVYVYPEIIAETVVDRGGLSQFSTLNSRTIYWTTAWEAIKLNPIWGYGMGTFTFTGIKISQPFNIIHFVHNDYLQVWHDLGLIYAIALIATVFYLLVKHMPFRLKVYPKSANIKLAIDTSNQHKFIAWWLFLCVALYMSINFLIYNLEFQVIIVLLVLDLVRDN